ncbi:MAG: hypothetical protein ACTSQJ_16440, partial [Promethearchaeota archaeon]
MEHPNKNKIENLVQNNNDDNNNDKKKEFIKNENEYKTFNHLEKDIIYNNSNNDYQKENNFSNHSKKSTLNRINDAKSEYDIFKHKLSLIEE